MRLSRWPLFVVALGAVILVAARMLWPRLNFDHTSLVLFGCAALALLVAYLPLKRVKWGDFEAELDRDMDALEKRVVASEEAPSPAGTESRRRSSGATVARHAVYDEYLALVNSPSSNVEKILAAGILVEKMVQSTAADFSLVAPGTAPGVRPLVERLAAENLIGSKEVAAFHDYWAIRNKVVHRGYQPTDDQTARLLDLAWRLIRALG